MRILWLVSQEQALKMIFLNCRITDNRFWSCPLWCSFIGSVLIVVYYKFKAEKNGSSRNVDFLDSVIVHDLQRYYIGTQCMIGSERIFVTGVDCLKTFEFWLTSLFSRDLKFLDKLGSNNYCFRVCPFWGFVGELVALLEPYQFLVFDIDTL